MRIETGAQEDHPTPLPLQDTGPGITALAGVTATGASGTQGGVFDATAAFGEQAAAGAADVAAAMSAGMTAETDRRQHYAQDVLPQGASYGDAMTLPDVPAERGARGELG